MALIDWEAAGPVDPLVEMAQPIALWAMAWRARSAAWIVRHRAMLEAALVRAS